MRNSLLISLLLLSGCSTNTGIGLQHHLNNGVASKPIPYAIELKSGSLITGAQLKFSFLDDHNVVVKDVNNYVLYRFGKGSLFLDTGAEWSYWKDRQFRKPEISHTFRVGHTFIDNKNLSIEFIFEGDNLKVFYRGKL